MAQVIQKAVEHSIRLAERGGGNVGGVSQGRGILKAGGGVLGVKLGGHGDVDTDGGLWMPDFP